MNGLKLLLALNVIAFPSGCSTKCTASRPNVLLIVIDTARADHFSSYGYNRQTTPNIDELARDAVRFSHAHSVAPWTLPAHMSMFTGLLPGQHGATWDAFSSPPQMSIQEMMTRRFVPADPGRMLATRLKAVGYRTWGISSNPWVGVRTGINAGFDTFTEVWRPWPGYAHHYTRLPPGLKIDANLDRTLTGMSMVSLKRKISTGRGKGPFFAFLNLVDPHYPYVPPPEFVNKFSGNPDVLARIFRRPAEFSELALLGGYRPIDLKELIPFYDAELSYVDFMVGNLIDWLRRKHLYDETLIVITSDHGEHLGEKGRFSHQLSIQEELLAVPLIIKFPNSANAGVVIDNPLVANMDVYETILAATSGTVGLKDYDSASVDLTRLIEEGTINRRQLLSELYFSDAYLRQIERHYAPFEKRAHTVVRRAMYMDGHKFMFEDLTQISIEPVGKQLAPANEPLDREAARTTIRQYIESIGGEGLTRLEPTAEDHEFTDRLRSLGYLDESTAPSARPEEAHGHLK